jgi:hypothetical protein
MGAYDRGGTAVDQTVVDTPRDVVRRLRGREDIAGDLGSKTFELLCRHC